MKKVAMFIFNSNIVDEMNKEILYSQKLYIKIQLLEEILQSKEIIQLIKEYPNDSETIGAILGLKKVLTGSQPLLDCSI